MRKLLSIIVPTINRYEYLKHLIHLIESFNSDDIELVIQDNSIDNTEFLEFLDEKECLWIKYFYCSNKLTSVENFDKAVLSATGEYLCFIGDDDGVVRNIVSCVKWMKNNEIDVLRGIRSDYYWLETGKHGGLLYNDNISEVAKVLDPKKELVAMLKKGCQDLHRLPLLYTGIVNRSTLDEIFEIGKTYFPGASGDIANGVALAFKAKRYVFVNIPIVISGTSANTGGGVYKIKKRRLKLSEVSFISKSTVDNWERCFPDLWSGSLVWPESAIKALRFMSEEKFIRKLNKELVLASFVFNNPSYFKLTFRYSQFKLKFIFYIIFLLIRFISIGVADRFIRVYSKRSKCLNGQIKYNVQNISSAEEILYKKIKGIDLKTLSIS